VKKETKTLIIVGAITAGVALIVETFGERALDKWFPEKGKRPADCPPCPKKDQMAGIEASELT
jgi:hypothetical protein